MNEESLKAVELNDSEMDKVTGGAAILMHKDDKGTCFLWEARCDKLNSASDFYNFYYPGATDCQHYHRKSGVSNSWKVCTDCKHYHYFDMTKNQYDKGSIQDVKYV